MKMNNSRVWSLALGLFVAAAPLFAATKTVTLEPAKSSIKWVGKKVTGQHDGTIKMSSGKVQLDGKEIKGGEFTVDMPSLEVSDLKDPEYNAKLTGHLKSDDFFGVDKFPTSTFVIKSVKPLAGSPESTHEISGDMTIKGKTAPLTFPAKIQLGDKTVTADAKLKIDRTLYDIRYGSTKFFDKLGDKAIYDEFTLDVHLEGMR